MDTYRHWRVAQRSPFSSLAPLDRRATALEEHRPPWLASRAHTRMHHLVRREAEDAVRSD